MGASLTSLLSRSVDAAARRRVTKEKTYSQARTEIIKAIAKADGTSTSVTYMVLRGEAICPMRKCLQAFAQVLPNVGMGQIMSAVKKDGCIYRSNGYGFKPKSGSSSSSSSKARSKRKQRPNADKPQ